MPPKEKRKPKQKSEVTKIDRSSGFVIGDFAKFFYTVIQGVDKKILRRFGLEQRIGFLLLGVLIIATGSGIYFALRPVQSSMMSGQMRIAVASFYEDGNSEQKNLGYDLANTVYSYLDQNIEEIKKEIDPEMDIMIWEPDKVDRFGVISGNTVELRSEQAEKIADIIKADIVIYGVIYSNGTIWQVQPEFIILAENSYEVSEFVGQYDLGNAIEMPGYPNPAWRKEFTDQMLARTKALAIMSVGLGYFVLQEYDKALATLQSGFDIPNWPDNQGKKVLYIMAGAAASKVGEISEETEKPQEYYDLAEQLLNEARRIDPKYARPYIGLANLSYLRALQPFNESKRPETIDILQFQECYRYLDQAQDAVHTPLLADSETKIHFVRGQCLMMHSFYDGAIGRNPNYKPAEYEFRQVITDFGNGANPHIQVLAAEAHGRLALIHRLSGKNHDAIQEYNTAIKLLSNYPERREVFRDAVSTLTATP